MNIRVTKILSIATLASISISPVFAEGHSARFEFAPNYYRLEEPRIPHALQEEMNHHSVRSGSVPHSSNFLGVEPSMVARPNAVAPVAQMAVTGRPGFAPLVPPANQAFQPAFGKPAHAQALASLPKMASPLSITQPVKVLSRKPSSRVSQKVHGNLIKPARAVGRHAIPAIALGKDLDSYGKNFGYVPGPFLPTNSGAGLRTSADVTGKLLKH